MLTSVIKYNMLY